MKFFRSNVSKESRLVRFGSMRLAVEKFVQTSDRLAMRIVEPLSEANFLKKLKRDKKWKETFEIVCNAYKSLQPDFAITHDIFGGYHLIYTGKNVIKASCVLRRNPVGFIREVPEGVATNLSLMSSERTGKQLLLLGPMRFVNSDCSPNCEYDFLSELNIVQLRVKKRLNPDDEVDFRPDFFETNACLCRTCENKLKADFQETVYFQLILEDVLYELVSSAVLKIRKEHRNENVNNRKNRRVKGRELVELYNNLTRSPLSSTDSSEMSLNCTLESVSTLEKSFLNKTTETLTESDIEQNSSLLECETAPQTSNKSSTDNTVENVQPSKELARASSPVTQFTSLSYSLSGFAEEPSLYVTEETDQSDELYIGSAVTVNEARDLTELFCSKFHLSDECASSLHSLMQSFLPEGNVFPSGYSYIKNMKKLRWPGSCNSEDGGKLITV